MSWFTQIFNRKDAASTSPVPTLDALSISTTAATMAATTPPTTSATATPTTPRSGLLSLSSSTSPRSIRTSNSILLSSSSGGITNSPIIASSPTPLVLSLPSSLNASLQKKIKQFNEDWHTYIKTPTEEEKTPGLHKLLKPFLKIYEDPEAQNLLGETFPDCKRFGGTIAAKLVQSLQEIQRTAPSTEQHAALVLTFLQTSGDKVFGLELLRCLEIIATNAGLVDVLVESGIPSTFVKLTQLFFFLPVGASEKAARAKPEQRVATLLLTLCNFRLVVNELLKSDSLHVLFSLLAIQCPPHNSSNRERIMPVISYLVKYHLESEVVEYLSKKGSISKVNSCLVNGGSNFNPDSLVSVYTILFDCLKGSTAVSGSVLLDDFEQADGYRSLTSLLLSIETRDEATCSAVDRILDLVCDFVYVGTETLKPTRINSPYTNNNAQTTSILQEDVASCVRNGEAFQVLQNFFLKSTVTSLRLKVLDCILSIYAANYVNYSLLQQFHTLAYFIELLESLSFELQDGVLRVLVFVVTVVNCVPFQELSSLSCLLQDKPSPTTVVMIFQTVAKLINFDAKYKSIFQEAGLLHMLINLLKQFHVKNFARTSDILETPVTQSEPTTIAPVPSPSPTDLSSESGAHYTVVMDCITLLLEGVSENVRIFRESGCTRMLYSFVHSKEARPGALSVLQQLVQQDGDQNQGDMAGLIKLVQTVPVASMLDMKKDIINTIRRVFLSNKKTRDSFREFGGFVSLASLMFAIVDTFEGKMEEDSEQEKVSVLEVTFKTCTAAISGHPKNRKFFRDQIVGTLSTGLRSPHFLYSRHLTKVLECLLDLATENVAAGDSELTEETLLYNPYVVLVILDLLSQSPEDLQEDFIKRLNLLVKSNKKNQDALSKMGAVGFLLKHFSTKLRCGGDDVLQQELLSLLESICTYRISGAELRQFLRLLAPDGLDSTVPEHIVSSLLNISKADRSPPHIIFDMRKTGYACMHVPTLGDRAWPPTNGFSFLFWLYIDNLGVGADELELFHFSSDDKKSSLQCFLQKGKMTFQSSTQPKQLFMDFSSFRFEPQKWYHVALVHIRHRFGSDEMRLLVNGILKFTAKSAIVPSGSGSNMGIYFGTPSTSGRAQHSDQRWRLGPTYLIEDLLTPNVIHSIFAMGPSYHFNFQSGQFSRHQTYEVICHENLTLIKEQDHTSPLGPLDLSTASITIPEDKILLSLNARTALTLEELENVSDDTEDPGIVMVNSADMGGNSKAILTGGCLPLNTGSVASCLRRIGGVSAILLLVEASDTPELLVKSLQLLMSLVQGNAINTSDMENAKGYEIIGYFLKESQQHSVTVEVMDTLFEFAGFRKDSPRTSVIANTLAFKHLLLDYEIWKNRPLAVQKVYFQRLQDFIYDNVQKIFNVWRMQSLHVLPRFLSILKDDSLPDELLPSVMLLISNFLQFSLTEGNLEDISSFLLGTLVTDRQYLSMLGGGLSSSEGRRKRSRSLSTKRFGAGLPRMVVIRNMMMITLLELVGRYDSILLFSKVFHPNFMLSFVDHNLHNSTVTLMMKILAILYQEKKASWFTRFNSIDGFTILEQVLPSYSRCVDIYFILMCLVLGKPIYELPSKPISRISFADLIANFQLPELHLHCLEAVNVIALMLSKIGEGSELLPLVTPTSRSHEELPSPPMFGTSVSDTALVPPLSPSTSGTSLQTQQALSPSPTTLRGSLDGGAQQEGGSNAVLSVVRKMTGWTLPIGRTSVSTNVTAAKPLPSEDPQQDPPGEASRGIRGIFARKSPSLSSAQVVGGAPSSPPTSPTTSLSPSASPQPLQPSPPSSPSTSSVVYSPPSLSRSNDEDWDMMQSILSFLLHLTNNMTELQDALLTDSAAHLIENLASILFPHGNLNFPYSGAEEANHPTTEKRYQASGSVFQLLTQVCCCAVKNSIKALAILDTVLEAAPLNTTEVQFIVYQSKILGDTIKTLQGSVSKKAFQENSKFANNTAKFCTLLVDKIQQGLFPSGGRLVFKFFVTTLERLDDLSSDGSSSSGSRFQKSKLFGDLSTIYRALHRLIIYFLSSPTCTVNDFGYIINSVLHHQNVIFNSSISTGVNLSNEQEFVYCLCHHLYKFLLHDNRGLREGAMGIWKLLLQKKTELMNEVLIHKPATKGGDTVDLKTGGFDLLLQQDFNAFSFWMTDSVSTIHSVFEELLSKVWLAYQTGENNNKIDQLKRLKARRLKRLQKKVKKDRTDEGVRGKHSSWKTTTKEAVKESDLAKLRVARQEENDRRKFVSILWEKQRVRLTLEKSVWGSDFPNPFDKWKLDSTEGPSRMRKRLERNLRFYIQYPPSSAGGGSNAGSSTAVVRSNSASGLSELERNASFTEKTPTSFDSKPYYEIYGEPQQPRTPDNQTVGPRRRTGSHLLHPSLSISLPELSVDSSPSSGGSLSNSLTTLPSVGDLSLRGVQKLKADAEKSLNDFLHRLLPEEEQGALTAGGDESDDDVSDEPSEEEIEASLEESIDDLTPNTVKLQSMLEPGDVVEKVFNCGRVSGLDYRDCIFILGKLNAYTIDEYRVDEVTGELIETCSERILTWEHPSALATVLQTSGPVTTPSSPSHSHSHSHTSTSSTTPSYHDHVAHTHHCRKWAYEDIRDIAKRRYLLRPVALELFSTDGRNHLLVFEFLLREEVFRLLNLKLNEFSSPEKSDSKESLPDIQELEQAEGVNKLRLWRKAPLTQRWQKGQLTNFQYLMYLNTLAGRSYNDLTQYPVFPWVLVDYESEELNLHDPKVFRDLSKPMGALEPHRAAEFQNRYDGWTPEENNNVPKWHYGTHYSSAAIILYYMIRVEPFTQQFVSLQGGKFDHPDRLFCSILETWKSASGVQNNMADVKELVPEFFYLPQVFENTNNFDFGKKQTGEQLSDVILPPWSKNDPTEFIRRHREALESDYVSEHLNEWIDLVFGCKQQSKAAEEALNVFYYLTYEGAVDLDAISDPTVKEATIAQINNFGQTPTQLFKKPHPKRHPLPVVTNIFTSDFLERSCAKDVTGPVHNIRFLSDKGEKVIAVGAGKLIVPPACNSYFAWGFPDFSGRILALDTDKVLAIREGMHEGPINCVAITEDGKILITGGCDTVVAVHKIQDGKVRRINFVYNLCNHLAPVVSVAVSRAFSIVVSASEDHECFLWDLNRLKFIRQLSHEAPKTESSLHTVVINEANGDIVGCSSFWLHLWSVNGNLLLSKRMSSLVSDSITAFAFTKVPEWTDKYVLLTGHRDGVIKSWNTDWKPLVEEEQNDYTETTFTPGRRTKTHNRDLAVFSHLNFHSHAITSFFITGDQKRLFSGDASGHVISWAEPGPLSAVNSLPLP